MAFIRFKISYPPSYYKFLDLLCIIEKNDNYYLACTYIFSISLYIYIFRKYVDSLSQMIRRSRI